MLLSQRSAVSKTLNRLSQLKLKHPHFIDLTLSNPTKCGFEASPQALKALALPSASRYQACSEGLLGARQAVSQYYQKRGLSVLPEQILITCSTSEAYLLLFHLLADQSEYILEPNPSYPLFGQLAQMAGVRLANYPLVYRPSQGWKLPAPAFSKIPDSCRALIEVSPNNPTGTIYSPTERARIDILCQEKQLSIISDEVFMDYLTEPGLFAQTSRASQKKGLCFVLSGLSKVAALPQFKLFWIVVTGETQAQEEALDRLAHLTDTLLSTSGPVQHALPLLLEKSEITQVRLRQRLAQNQALLKQQLSGSPVRILKRDGGWSALLELPGYFDDRVWDDESWAEHLLEEHGVLLQPGYFYGIEPQICLVLSLLVPSEQLQAGLSRLLTAFS